MTTYTVTATATDATTDRITVSSVTNMFSGMPIIFSGTVFGGITAGATYYIGTVVPGFPTSTITVTSLPGGAVVALSTAAGSMTGTFNSGGQQIIDIGAAPNDGTGDPLRTAFNDTNVNFDQVFAAGPVGSNIQIANNTIKTIDTNGNLVLAPNGTGVVQSNVTIVPNTANVRNLGSAAQRWSTIYTQYLDISGTLTTGDLTVDGNLTVQGNIIQVGNIVTETLTIQLANAASTANAANGAGITVGANDNIATLLYSSTNNTWTTNIGLSSVGNITAPYFFGNGSQLTGLAATYGNANVVANLAALGSNPVSTTGNITGGFIFGNISQANGFPATYGNANVANYLPTFSGNISAGNVSASGNVTGAYVKGNGSELTNLPAPTVTQDITSNGAMSIMTYDGAIKYVNYATVEPSSGNIAGGNITTTGLVSATGNITAGNLNSPRLNNSGNISVVAGGNAWAFGTDGRLINLEGLTLTAGGQFNICTILTGGSGYNTGSALKATTGGSGTGMTVGIGYGLSNQLTNVGVVDPGTGYVDGDVITVSEGTGGTFVITQYNEQANQANNNFIESDWTFDADGGTIFPTLTVTRGDRTGSLTGQTLLFGDATQEALISTPNGVANVTPNSQRLVINPGAGAAGTTGEGGDIYLYAGRGGDAGGSGGDIKIRGGLGPVDGAGGYITMEGGEADVDGIGGYIEIIGGVSGNSAGGTLYMYGGQGRTGGDANVSGGFGATGPGGTVSIIGGGSANGQAEYGNIIVATGSKNWTFDNTGNLVLPSGTPSINYANGDPFSGGAVNTGNVTFDDVNIIGTSNLKLQPDSANVDAYLDIYLTSGPDIHIAGNGETVILGTDDFANVTVNVDGNVSIQASNGTPHTWTFDTAGNLNLPGNTIAINYLNGNLAFGTVTFNNEAVIGTGTSNTQSGLYLAPDPVSLANDLYLRVRGNILDEPTHIHFDTGNNQYYNQYIGDDNKYILLANTGNVVVNTNDNAGNSAQWIFNNFGTLSLPGGSQIRPLGANLDIIAGIGSYVNLITTDESTSVGVDGAGGYITTAGGTWDFDTTGNLTAPGNVSAVGNIIGGNIVTSGNITTAGSGGDITLTGGNITGAGNISAGNLIATGNIVLTGSLVGSGASPAPSLSGFSSVSAITVSASGNVTAGNVSTGMITLTNGATIKNTAGNAIAIGYLAGNTSQGSYATAIGFGAGGTSQGTDAIAIGGSAGSTSQGNYGVSIGYLAGQTSQGNYGVSIGRQAGFFVQGISSVAIGYLAGNTNQANNSIIINATGAVLDQTTANTFTVAPIRNDVANTGQVVFYNTSSKEVTYGNTISVAGNVTAGNFVGNGATLSNVATQVTGTWTVPVGNSTQSFTVSNIGTYSMWVDCNITNGILAWNATATVTNNNVPVVGAQYAWVYNGGGTPVDFTSIPNQFTGTANTIVRSSVAPSATTNRFDFGINNTSGGNVTVRYGYTKIS